MKKLLILSMALLGLSACGTQELPASKNQVEASFAEISNQYKRRQDLIPNLVQVVKGYASHEKETLEGVISARAKATQVVIDPSNVTPEKLVEYQKAQNGLSQALGKLMVVKENYPELKANEQFRDLQAQLEGTENRIAVARQRYIASVKDFNDLVTVPPTSWTNTAMYKYEKVPQWELEPGEKEKAEKAPDIKF